MNVSKLTNLIKPLIQQVRYSFCTLHSILAFFAKKKSLVSLTQAECHLFHKLPSLVIIYYFNTELTHIGSKGFG